MSECIRGFRAAMRGGVGGKRRATACLLLLLLSKAARGKERKYRLSPDPIYLSIYLVLRPNTYLLGERLSLHQVFVLGLVPRRQRRGPSGARQ